MVAGLPDYCWSFRSKFLPLSLDFSPYKAQNLCPQYLKHKNPKITGEFLTDTTQTNMFTKPIHTAN
jgi:hypothetical protein